MTRRLAIVPARGGSKRLPHKNVRPFLGRPMLTHILATAAESKVFDTIHVSTDSQEIADVAAAAGFPVPFLRPAELADDVTPLMPVLKQVLEAYQERGETFDTVALLMACAPLVQAADLRGAVELFDAHGKAHTVLGTSCYPAPIEWAYLREEDGRLVPTQPGAFAIRSQDLPKHHFDAGVFALFAAEYVLGSSGAGVDTNTIGYPIPRASAVDIDDEEDWAFAESLARGRLPSLADSFGALKRLLVLPVRGEGVLRCLTPDDITAEYVDGLNDPVVHEYLEGPRKTRQTSETVAAFVRENLAHDRHLLLGLFVEGRHRGSVRLHDIDWAKRTGFVGIAIFDREVWGRGWATASLCAVRDFARDALQLRALYAGIDPENVGSVRAFEKAGFRFTPGAAGERDWWIAGLNGPGQE